VRQGEGAGSCRRQSCIFEKQAEHPLSFGDFGKDRGEGARSSRDDRPFFREADRTSFSGHAHFRKNMCGGWMRKEGDGSQGFYMRLRSSE
jgi:hypothetical protein